MGGEPTHCRQGHQFGPRLVHLTWTSCGCPGARHGGHRVYYCEHVIGGQRCGDMQVWGHVEDES